MTTFKTCKLFAATPKAVFSAFEEPGCFVVVEPVRKIVIKHLSKPHFQLSIGLEGNASGTLVTWEQTFENPEVAASLRQIVEPANEQNLNRWQAAVAHGLHGID